MSNHIHLAIQVGVGLSKIMQNLSFRHAQWINKRQSRVGHLFQGRPLTEDKAKTVIEQVRIIVGQWRERLAGDGVGEADLERLQTAFLTGSVFAGYSDS